MKAVRACLCVVYVLYLGAAIAFPHTMYVDRFLLNLQFSSWALAQMLPSMYTTEIRIMGSDPNNWIAVPHHPARIFFEVWKTDPNCSSFNISVRYRGQSGQRDYLICGSRLYLDKREP
jgi:hypothetical protein